MKASEINKNEQDDIDSKCYQTVFLFFSRDIKEWFYDDKACSKARDYIELFVNFQNANSVYKAALALLSDIVKKMNLKPKNNIQIEVIFYLNDWAHKNLDDDFFQSSEVVCLMHCPIMINKESFRPLYQHYDTQLKYLVTQLSNRPRYIVPMVQKAVVSLMNSRHSGVKFLYRNFLIFIQASFNCSHAQYEFACMVSHQNMNHKQSIIELIIENNEEMLLHHLVKNMDHVSIEFIFSNQSILEALQQSFKNLKTLKAVLGEMSQCCVQSILLNQKYLLSLIKRSTQGFTLFSDSGIREIIFDKLDAKEFVFVFKKILLDLIWNHKLQGFERTSDIIQKTIHFMGSHIRAKIFLNDNSDPLWQKGLVLKEDVVTMICQNVLIKDSLRIPQDFNYEQVKAWYQTKVGDNQKRRKDFHEEVIHKIMKADMVKMLYQNRYAGACCAMLQDISYDVINNTYPDIISACSSGVYIPNKELQELALFLDEKKRGHEASEGSQSLPRGVPESNNH
ncbi:MAG TPA: hypothetical protein QF353_05915 [Gammaproteobacteria bacterium]|nr:hypothetical protein [Gammaproteobacteria bacterium]